MTQHTVSQPSPYRQAAFRASLLDATQPVPDGLTDGDGRPAGRRYAVYRNNVAVSLREALVTGFPAIHSLIGAENFDHIAGLFLRQNPPVSPLMMHYGLGFPDFLAGFSPLAHLGYLPDVARLELAMRQSYHAADAPRFDPARLADLDEPSLMSARFTFAPSVHYMPSPWPVVSVWRVATRPGSPKPPAQAECVLITRPDYDPEPHPLSLDAAHFVRALMRGMCFRDALETAGDGFDLGPTLNLLLTQGALTDMTLKGPDL
ncbi:MAG: putative DNA-binding domain-containing protein [Primorskyibacter sp.]